jgi:5'-3' exonuclease
VGRSFVCWSPVEDLHEVRPIRAGIAFPFGRVASVGEKTAASLLGEYGTLNGLLATAADAGSGLSASVLSKLAAATDYLTVAPAVVKIGRDLERLATEWNLGGSVRRLFEALDPRH